MIDRGPIAARWTWNLRLILIFQTHSTVDPALKGRTIQRRRTLRVFMDDHVQFIRDARTPLQ